MNILFIGDVVGKAGRRTLACLVPQLRDRHNLDLVIANGENAAGGKGLTPNTADEILQAGVDVITSGNHIWHHRDIYKTLESDAPILRPMNYPEGAPGRGFLIHNGVAIINLMGRVFMPGALDCPFRTAERALEATAHARVHLIDLHAEATSEKAALAWYLNGRVSAVLGTHTHIPTADARILPNGTAFVSDVGMVGPRDSILGMEKEPVIQGFLTQLPVRFNAMEDGPVIFNSVLVHIDETTGRAQSIQRIDCEVSNA